METEVQDGLGMVGDGVDGVWETGGMVSEEELVVIPFACIFPSNISILSSLSSELALNSNTRFLRCSSPSWKSIVEVV